MRKYARYKDSGISWIGEVPEHWNYYPFYALFEQKSQCGFCDEGLLSVYLDKGVIRFSDAGEKRANATSEDLSKYQLVEEGDFVLNNQQAWRGSVGVSFFRGIVSPAYVILKMSEKLERTFANYLLRDRSMVAMYCLASKGVGSIQRNLVWNKVKRSAIFIPPLSEQKTIAEYLDKKTAQINELVSAKQKQIELLKEYKQSVIANAVTGKLDERREKRKWKDSGISWIGKIPENWEVKRAKYMFKKEKRDVRDSDDVVTCFRDGEVTLRKNRRTSGFTESITEIGYQGIRKNDLVIHQMDAFAGAIGVSDSDGKGTSVYHCCTPLGDYDVRYYASLLRIMAKKGFIQSLYRGIRERSSDFNFQVFGKQYLVVPPLSEQKEIVAYIEKKVSSIDSQIASIENQIANLNEYKQSLISDVVTGKVKVC